MQMSALRQSWRNKFALAIRRDDVGRILSKPPILVSERGGSIIAVISPSWNLRLFRHRLGRYERAEINGGAGSGDNEVHEHVLSMVASNICRADGALRVPQCRHVHRQT